MRYKPEVKNFDQYDTKHIQNYEDRERTIKELDTGMSPFMKNQNDHFQRMKRSVARQEQIAEQYVSGKQINFAMAEAQKDAKLQDLSSINAERVGAKASNAM